MYIKHVYYIAYRICIVNGAYTVMAQALPHIGK